MRKSSMCLLALLVAAYTPKSFADEQPVWYLGASYSFQNVSYKSMSDQDIGAVGLVAGYKINDIITLESRLNTGTSSDSFDVPVTKLFTWKNTQKIDYQSSFLAKASYPLFKDFSVYGLVGYSLTKSKITDFITQSDFDGNLLIEMTEHSSEKTEGLTYGLGINYQLAEQFTVFLDYQVLPDFDEGGAMLADWSSASLGFYYSF